MVNRTTHEVRIRQELQQVGVTAFGLLKFGIRYLPKVLDENEHINGAAYGRYREENGDSSWNWEEGTLVATDRRVLFIDRKPGYLRSDNITYDAVAGVEASKAGIFSAVTLSTRVGTFSLRYVRRDCADVFTAYVDKRRLEPA